MASILTVKQLQKYYGGSGNLTKAVDGISFSVEQGGFIGIMGASGSGKTTLLSCISTIDRPTAGQICIGGTDITAMKEKQLAAFRRDKLGADKPMLRRALLRQIAVYFLLPLLLAVVYSFFGLWAANETLMADGGMGNMSGSIAATAAFVGAMYLAYFGMIYVSAKSCLKL